MRFIVLCLLWTTTAALVWAQQPRLAASIAPNARSVTVGEPATFFATVINAGPVEAANCRVQAANGNDLGNDLDYQRTDASNQPIGAANTPFNLAASGGSQTLVLTIRPTSGAEASLYELEYVCDNTQLSGMPGVSEPFIRAGAGTGGSDVIMILQTLSNDGVIRIDENGRRGVAAGAALNIGSDSQRLRFTPYFPGYIGEPSYTSATPAAPSYNQYRDLLICQTDATAVCINPPAAAFEVQQLAANEPLTFNVFFDDSAAGSVPFLPEFMRIMVVVVELSSGGFSLPMGVPGATSVAVSEPNGPAIADEQTASGQWYGYYGDPADFTNQRVKITMTPDGHFLLRSRTNTNVNGGEPPQEFLIGQVSINRDGSTLRPTGMVTRWSGPDSTPTQTAIDGLVLELGGAPSGRIEALGNLPLRGFSLRDIPEETLRFAPPAAGHTRNFSATNVSSQAPFILHSVQIAVDGSHFTGIGRIEDGQLVSNCPVSFTATPREAQGGPAPQVFDMTMTVDACEGDASANPSGTYTGIGIAENWVDDARLPGGRAACQITASLSPQTGGNAFLFVIAGDLSVSNAPDPGSINLTCEDWTF